MSYSVQQIKFELASYVKEFGGDFTQWSVGTADDAPQALFERHQVDPVNDVWLWKPALTSAAATMVARWMIDRQGSTAVGEAGGDHVYIFRRAAEADAAALLRTWGGNDTDEAVERFGKDGS